MGLGMNEIGSEFNQECVGLTERELEGMRLGVSGSRRG